MASIAVDETLRELLNISVTCKNHELSEDAYPAPQFLSYIGRPITVGDIPMESSSSINGKYLRKDPSKIPWENSIKNFVYDLTSVTTKQKFNMLVILFEYEYSFVDTTSKLVGEKYMEEKTRVLEIIPTDSEKSEFTARFKENDITQITWQIEKKYLVNEISVWFTSPNILLLCHDNSISEYRSIVTIAPDITWSVPCTISYYAESVESNKEYNYICPVYSCSGFIETRVVGRGKIKFIKDTVPARYEAKMNYYLKCIRGSRQSSGRCYDCEVLYRTISSSYKSPLSSPSTPKVAKFYSKFLSSVAGE